MPRIPRDLDGAPLDPNCPHELSGDDPAEIYRNLPRDTRKWLEGKKKKDLDDMDAAIEFYKTALAVGKVNAKIVGIIVAIFLGTVGLITGIKTVLSWLPGGKP